MKEIEFAAKIILEADALLITAGSGMGADSGLSTFRGKNGIYQNDEDIESIINSNWFVRDPRQAWKYYFERIDEYEITKPHFGYRLLREICESKVLGYFVYTRAC